MAELGTLPSWTDPGHYAAGMSGVTVSEATIAAAWNVQGNLAHAPFADAVRRQFGVTLPAAPDSTARSGALTALWLGPRSWLLVCGNASSLTDFDAGRGPINGAGGALFDVSASRIAWTVSGQQATAVLARGCPLDFHPRAFAVDTCAQSLYGHIGMLIVKHDEAPTFTLFVPRSYASDAWHSLLTAAAQYGVDIGAATPYR